MKKFIKFCFILGVCGVILTGGALLTLRLLFPPEKIKQITLEYAKNTLHREVQFQSVSFNLIGITLTDFALSEENSFEQGTFLKAKNLHAKISLWPLLKKRVEIDTLLLDELDINLVAHKDGSFNFDSLLSTSSGQTATEKETPSADNIPFIITAQHLAATDCNLTYQNQQTGLTTRLNHLNIRVEDFDLTSPFSAAVSFVSQTQETNGLTVSVPVDIVVEIFLDNLRLPNAYVQVTRASAAYKKLALNLSGKIENFENPSVNLTGSLTGLNHTALADLLPELPSFSLPKIDLALRVAANLQNSSAQIQSASLRILDNTLKVTGTLGWEKTFTYRLNGQLQADLAQIVQMANTSEFSPQGTLSASLTASDRKNGKDVSGTVILKNLSARYAPFTLTQTNGTLKI